MYYIIDSAYNSKILRNLVTESIVVDKGQSGWVYLVSNNDWFEGQVLGKLKVELLDLNIILVDNFGQNDVWDDHLIKLKCTGLVQ